MNEPFIPPEGAMQFELLPKYAAMIDVSVFWVLPADFHMSHECRWFDVIDPTEGMKARGRSLGWLTEGKTPIVCECVGRIIE